MSQPELSSSVPQFRIGIDLMGGDTSPEELFPAILEAAQMLPPSHSFLAIVTKSVANQLMPIIKSTPLPKQDSIQLRIVADAIAMVDDPVGAVRRKRGSSLVVGIRLLKKKQLSALISCGNTGALIAAATLSLTLLPGVKRPALLATLPTEKGTVAILDVGGNVSSKANHLVAFAHLGIAYQKAMKEVNLPTLGLLNIGVESKKGTREIRQAYEILKSQAVQRENGSNFYNFIGNIEARDVFKGAVDVLVTDGFTGNILLKTTEGMASFILNSIKKAAIFQDNALEQVLSSLNKRFNYREHPGALVCGVEALIVKAHGNASASTLLFSILQAATLAEKNIIALMKAELQSIFE